MDAHFGICVEKVDTDAREEARKDVSWQSRNEGDPDLKTMEYYTEGGRGRTEATE